MPLVRVAPDQCGLALRDVLQQAAEVCGRLRPIGLRMGMGRYQDDCRHKHFQEMALFHIAGRFKDRLWNFVV
ncbi:hypothetical protein [Ralstonia chuxiongensis]|uniref:Uncharacterized protein n=1 Tax=Ralstonia chuxiongensis TaxID=2957504 RepID=A0AA41WV13_9RALS|nr:hypothetical protein [Ralstonia chuxiongensis]MCP1175690.1 hypothetical protein [Ralstonia chuxiongensis]